MNPEQLKKLKDLWEKSSQGKVSQMVGRDHPKRIDLVMGVNPDEITQKIEALNDQIRILQAQKTELEKSAQLLVHAHPVMPTNPKEVNPNSQNDINLVEALWNLVPEMIDQLKEE